MLRIYLTKILEKLWYSPPRNLYKYFPLLILLWPLTQLYRLITMVRRALYKVLAPAPVPVPVVVVGNLTVGGTGKTPLVIYLCELLRKQGWQPGVVSRGYRRQQHKHIPYTDIMVVTANSSAAEVGDEPLLISRRSGCPVVVGAKRAKAVAQLLQQFKQVDIVIADDGLQHYQLARDLEIAVIDGSRKFGNSLCLPAGPLREPLARLQQVDLVVINSRNDVKLANCQNSSVQMVHRYNIDNNVDTVVLADPPEFAMLLQPQRLYNLADLTKTCDLTEFVDKKVYTKVHAVAGIGNPERFFTTLTTIGLQIIPHIFPDHYQFTAADLAFNEPYPLIMTEKDALKCCEFATDSWWCLPIDVKISAEFDQAFIGLLGSRRK